MTPAPYGMRSYLFSPGDRPNLFAKAMDSAADAVILDLEDAVADREKERARREVAMWLSPERAVYVRVNGAAASLLDLDLAAVSRPGLVGVVLPKAETRDQLAVVRARTPRGTRIIPLVETARGLWNVRELAECEDVERLAFGSIDFKLDVGIGGDDLELLYARSHLVTASRVAGGMSPLDGVTTALGDADRLEVDIDRARRLGFGGKLCIHPSQADPVNQGFGPSSAEVAWAKRVRDAAEASGMGVARLDGEMIDRPVIEQAGEVLRRASHRPRASGDGSRGAPPPGLQTSEE